MVDVKICGITDHENLQASVKAGARFTGFVFYPNSPRFITFDTAIDLIRTLPKTVSSVGLFVNPSDLELMKVKTESLPNFIQLHGDETPERIKEVKLLTGLPVIKALRIAGYKDLKNIEEYETAADWLLFDAKPESAKLPGGTGQSFDWSLLKGRRFNKPWMLSGGLTCDNIGDALLVLEPSAVDVSSGVEKTRGHKDAKKIKNFINKVKTNG